MDPLEQTVPRSVVVTGGGSGIGRALARAFALTGAPIGVLDLDRTSAVATADELPPRPGGPGHVGLGVDVTDADALGGAVADLEEQLGPIGVFCSNAGIAVGAGLGEDDDWARSWAVHAMAHVHAARVVLPGMVSRGGGDFVITASAAGLLMMMQSAPYTVTKHASVAIAEWLAVAYGDAGVRLHCLAPQGVRTPMVTGGTDSAGRELAAAGAILEPDDVAAAVLAAVESGEFLVTPHPEVRDYEAAKVADRDRWLAAMRRLRSRM